MGRKTPPTFEIDIEHIVFGGEGMGYFEDRPVFVFGVLPGERVRVAPIKVNSTFVKARLVEVLKSSVVRQQPQEDHFLTCSPWQVMPYELQLETKQSVVHSMWSRISGDKIAASVDIVPSSDVFAYRNKLEFSVIADEAGELQLAFHQRYRHSKFYTFTSCALGSDEMNAAARLVLDIVRNEQWEADWIKNILVRRSVATDDLIVVLYVTQEKILKITHESLGCTGFGIVYSDPRTPAAVTTSVLYTSGDLTITDTIGGIDLQYGYDSFFQVNPPTFTTLLERITPYLPSEKSRILDVYAGVGTIGLYAAARGHAVTLVESHPQAKQFALRNMEQNNITDINCIDVPAEQSNVDALLLETDVLVVDPPRSGLHPAVLETIAATGPRCFVYISCNPATQARDWKILQTQYTIQEWFLVDLYPQTPHVESVLILNKK